MPSRREILILGGVGVAAATAGVLLGSLATPSQSGVPELLSHALRDLDGRRRRVSDWRGKVIVCNFWATWCAPCREEIPILISAREKYVGNGAEIVGIGIDHATKIAQFVSEFRIPYPALVADDSAFETMKKLGNTAVALPYTVVLDRSGTLQRRHLGAWKAADLEAVLAAMLR